MNIYITHRKRRKRISVWVLIFSLISVLLFAISPLRAAAEGVQLSSGEQPAPEEGTESTVRTTSLVGIISTILAAVIIIAVIIFTVRGGA